MPNHVSLFCQIYYALITCAALASTCVPFLHVWARFGKLHHASNSSSGSWLVRALDVRVPKRRFADFYAVGVCACLTAAIWSAHAGGACRAASFLDSEARPTAAAEADARLCLALLSIHVIRRAAECAFVERPAAGSEMHVLSYFLGVSYYMLLPVAPLAECEAAGGDEERRGDAAAVLRRLLAVAVYTWGSAHQHICHCILASLRPLQGAVPYRAGPAAYRVPHGDWFACVTCPHYLAEVVLYASLLIAKPRDRTLSALLTWVTIGLAINARRAHRWYRATFADYPVSRHAMFPGLF
jgi:3-oxo-5-alpha-steroid 4-dehydrogenase 3